MAVDQVRGMTQSANTRTAFRCRVTHKMCVPAPTKHPDALLRRPRHSYMLLAHRLARATRARTIRNGSCGRHLSRRTHPLARRRQTQRPRSERETRPRGVVAPLEEVCFRRSGSAICVQSLDDSLNSAIRTTYRISLRSSSLLMPRYPSTRVV